MKLKLFLILSILLFGRLSSQSKAELIDVENINKYSEIINKDSRIVEHQFEVKSKSKIVKYKYSKKGNEIVKMSREWNQDNGNYIDTYTDYFLLKNGERVYADQSIVFNDRSNKEIMGGWSCTFWIHKNKVIHMTSLGHGKTEMDDWDYEKELKENFNYMLKIVREKDKTIKQK